MLLSQCDGIFYTGSTRDLKLRLLANSDGAVSFRPGCVRVAYPAHPGSRTGWWVNQAGIYNHALVSVGAE